MKQYQINRAYTALGHIANLQLPVRNARNVYMLSKQLENAYAFEVEQEKKLFEKYHGIVTADGGITFTNSNDAQGFGAEIEELHNLDVEIEFEPVTISCEAMGEQRITPADVACLDGFVTFE